MECLPEKKTDEENKELQELKKEVSDLLKDAQRDYYKEMRWIWIKLILAVIVVSLITFFAGLVYSLIVPPTSTTPTVDLSKLEGMVNVVFVATTTISGVMIGFVPVCGFFFIGESRQRQDSYERDWEKEKEKSKGEKLDLINKYYSLSNIIEQNLKSGVLKYVKTYTIFSIFLQFMSIFSYYAMTIFQILPIFAIINFNIFTLIFFGLVPLVQVALYQPYLRPVRYLMIEKEVIRFEPED